MIDSSSCRKDARVKAKDALSERDLARRSVQNWCILFSDLRLFTEKTSMTIKYLKLLVPVLLLIVSTAHAQRAEKFDIVNFTPPAGWDAKPSNEARTYSTSDEQAGTFCLITLVRSVPSQGSSKADFELLWKTLVADQFKPTSKPQMGSGGPKQGWAGEAGIAPVAVDELKGAAMLTTLTGNSVVVGVLAITNSDKHAKDIEAFVDSIVLPPVAASTAAPASPSEPASAENARLIGKWNRSGSVVPAYADPVAWGTAGYTKSRYEFRADGTYLHTERSFRMMMTNIIIVKETGKYSIDGNRITISPQKSTISSYKKAGGVDALGTLVKAENRPLETVTYNFTFHYFSGIQEWDLVLQADRPTNRDGPFSNNTTFPNAWYFDQKYTDGDLTSVKGN